MRRNLMWLMSTVTVVVLLFGYRTSRDVATEGDLAVPAAVAPATAATSAPSASSATRSSAPSGAGSSRSTSGGTSKSSKSSTSSRAPSSSAASPAATTRTVTGDEAQTQWGPVEVSLTIRAGKITAVSVPVYPNGNPRDYEINSYALPTLVQETMQAQSAQIDMVSGATVTSGGYLQSLQSALDKAGL